MKGWRLRKNGILKENLFSALIVSYIAIFVLSFVVGLLIITTSQKQTRESIYSYNTVLVNKMKDTINPIHDDVCEFSQMFPNDAAINIISKSGMSSSSYKELMPVLRTVNDFRQCKDYVHNVFVYCAESEFVVSGSIQKPESFFQNKQCSTDFQSTGFYDKNLRKKIGLHRK